MTPADWQSVATVLAFTAFFGIAWWALTPSNRKRFEADANLALDSDPIYQHKRQSDTDTREK